MKNNSSIDKLALLGGSKTIDRSFKRYNPIGSEEVAAAIRVVESGVLSKFLGCWDADFYGGPKVQEFERACESYFEVKHAITVNSWTSGLIAAVGAIGIEPGDEVIVSPWTMCASATAILHWNAIPVFADIEPETFNLDPKSVEANISPYTKAIMAVDIFGHSADMDVLMKIADKYHLKVISDTAQAPGAYYKGQYAGTVAHVGGYSLNYHKHIHTGEGGILVTDDDDIAERLQLIRNHAEAVVGDKGTKNLANMIGYNFRLGEIECAIGLEQLKKLKNLVATRQRAAERLSLGLKGLKGLRTPIVQPGCTHAYYVYPMVLDVESLGVGRDRIYEALVAEGIEGLEPGYANLHLLPMYQQKIAYGSKGFPWTSDICHRHVDYRQGICPVAEELQANQYLGYGMCFSDLSDDDVDLIVQSFIKVWEQMELLQ
ncbi:Cys/Met metabolism pyridoxal-phosphate-dependent enzymes:DegT/DnrJ/EryC1/StrS aminotransferase:Aromatic amino acid beta-eliminating lyase/threonine aldolase [Gloeomargarita lithophora Alchichica-D10]|uniref:Cys/Met metabolism pyridoxal-phosphate-dependent enzymes:DegT/DnrJ/EryC1/StrS aminotransferase:Aromatic amino acid beta-eliminating lyase/threonine aldolase n=1 Tax=Gloeomargarita lithophora Alchichica-D10 TaxID=1188229 RepID=A0A1J0AEY6_9CYAN|nr:DegT/DnrJ/EryC1/StrS family aminotransferase [Gloeomargarita lithophora]APB34506.1 Cys/Met metabolism pyridoxal-phosphate-dependent enzymes:DegT/DnrJ/EryC1/StrS aminotransferase:Aromatic amino acid beta-eliminating lyase/threonine aldolase [Gloeomargarita lithophora Alchichica-D10]